MLVPSFGRDLSKARRESRTGPQGVVLLGSTGSIGRTTLSVCERFPEKFRVVGIVANDNVSLLAQQARIFSVPTVITASPHRQASLQAALTAAGARPAIVGSGAAAVSELVSAEDVDIVVASVVGLSGLSGVLAALLSGKRVALANKESLVAGGELVAQALAGGGGELLPVDSEHAAIFQALQGVSLLEVDRIVLTASGGPFLRRDPGSLSSVTPAEAIKHPRWNMGAKISVDSATLVNKALELIEAHWLFGLPEERIDVLVHPQSIVHGLVELCDGTQLAQLGSPDMSAAIAAALSYPLRLPRVLSRLHLSEIRQLDFEALDDRRFPVVSIARAALKAGGSMTAVLNSANEEAVQCFLAGTLTFDQIVPWIERSLARFSGARAGSFDELLALDAEVRAFLRQ